MSKRRITLGIIIKSLRNVYFNIQCYLLLIACSTAQFCLYITILFNHTGGCEYCRKFMQWQYQHCLNCKCCPNKGCSDNISWCPVIKVLCRCVLCCTLCHCCCQCVNVQIPEVNVNYTVSQLLLAIYGRPLTFFPLTT